MSVDDSSLASSRDLSQARRRRQRSTRRARSESARAPQRLEHEISGEAPAETRDDGGAARVEESSVRSDSAASSSARLVIGPSQNCWYILVFSTSMNTRRTCSRCTCNVHVATCAVFVSLSCFRYRRSLKKRELKRFREMQQGTEEILTADKDEGENEGVSILPHPLEEGGVTEEGDTPGLDDTTAQITSLLQRIEGEERDGDG